MSLICASRRRIRRIASPAVNYCGGSCTDTNPINWLKRFYAACRARYANGWPEAETETAHTPEKETNA